MTKSFRDFDRENDKEIFTKKGEKKGKLSAFYSLVKKGVLTLKQAAEEMDMTIPQFETAIKDLSYEQ